MGLALLAHMAPIDVALRAQYSLSVYGAVILGFMGGCRWGFAASGMGEGAGWWPLSVSVAPALLAAAALIIGDVEALWILALGLVALFAADISLTRAGGAPAAPAAPPGGGPQCRVRPGGRLPAAPGQGRGLRHDPEGAPRPR